MVGIATLGTGSALGSSILNVIIALAFLRKNSPKSKLKINIHAASAQALLFFQHYYLENDIFELVDLPIVSREIESMIQLSTIGFENEELFYSNLTRPFDFWDKEFEFTSEITTSFWSGIKFRPKTEVFDICAHIRRGDKLIYESWMKVHSVRQYVEFIQERFEKPGKICVLTDDFQTFLEFQEFCKDWNLTTSSSAANTGFDIAKMNQSSNTIVKSEIERMLLDYNSIRNCKFFIGTKSSNVAAIATLLRGKTSTHCFH